MQQKSGDSCTPSIIPKRPHEAQKGQIFDIKTPVNFITGRKKGSKTAQKTRGKTKGKPEKNPVHNMGKVKSIDITPEFILDVKKYHSMGIMQKQIAEAYGISTSTWHRMVRENPDLQQAVAEGRLQIVHSLVSKAYQVAMDGDRAMIMFLLKTIGHFRENGNPHDLDKEEGAAGTPPLLSITVNDPVDAMKAYTDIMRDT